MPKSSIKSHQWWTGIDIPKNNWNKHSDTFADSSGLLHIPIYFRYMSLSHHSRQLRGSCHGRCRGAGGLEDLFRAFYQDFMEYHEDIYEDINWMILDVWRILMDSYMIEAESWPTMAGSYWIPMAPTGEHSGKIEQFSWFVFVFVSLNDGILFPSPPIEALKIGMM